jgi:uncharacterized protein (DUF1501 family)
MLSRRTFLRRYGMAMMATTLPGISFARAETESRFVLIVLRGAVDGLSIGVPYAEPAYAALRGEIALSPPGADDGVLKLDGLFGLHPSLANVYRMFQHREATLLHAVATPYRERSHFDGQDLLESGSERPDGTRDGWLNRALAHLDTGGEQSAAIAMAHNIPLVLRGSSPASSWAPSQMPDAAEETLQRIKGLYADDAFFSSRLERALESQDIAGDMNRDRKRIKRNEAARTMMLSAAKFLTAADGPRIAVMESGGWDTHQNQGAATGSLANKLQGLDGDLQALKQAMGETWSKTVVAVVTEFGRTARVNGTRGTDHGTASAALLLGGAVNGGRVISDWPGLQPAALFEGRDLKPTTDLRAAFKAVLADHMGIANRKLDREVFPGSQAVSALENLVRTGA